MITHFQGRSHLNHEKQEFAHNHQHLKTLEEVVHTIKPTAIIGKSISEIKVRLIRVWKMGSFHLILK